ncbi:hypothetical protein ACLBYA_19005 [Mycobacterium sp. C31M]
MNGDLTGRDRLLFEQIVAELKERSQYDCDFNEEDVEEIAKVRGLGRRAGRSLGWKVRTFQTDPAQRTDRRVRVIVAVTESSPLHEQLMDVRHKKAIRKIFADLG